MNKKINALKVKTYKYCKKNKKYTATLFNTL